MKQEIADCINTKHIYQIICIDHISLGLAHLSVTLDQPWMTEYLLRKRKV